MSAAQIPSAKFQFGVTGRNERVQEMIADGRLRRLPAIAPVADSPFIGRVKVARLFRRQRPNHRSGQLKTRPNPNRSAPPNFRPQLPCNANLIATIGKSQPWALSTNLVRERFNKLNLSRGLPPWNFALPRYLATILEPCGDCPDVAQGTIAAMVAEQNGTVPFSQTVLG